MSRVNAMGSSNRTCPNRHTSLTSQRRAIRRRFRTRLSELRSNLAHYKTQLQQTLTEAINMGVSRKEILHVIKNVASNK
jgi:hypothetical protein